MGTHINLILLLVLLTPGITAFAQSLSVFQLPEDSQIILDGKLNEKEWILADSINGLTMIEPNEGSLPSFDTKIKVLADSRTIYIGIICFDSEPDKIISFSKSRDSDMMDEDYIRIVFDTYNDGRRGYVFAVNPYGARYDALVSEFGEEENMNWDGSWEAVSVINNNSWSVEIALPVLNFAFEAETDEWGFNIERNIQRLLERNRWTGIDQDYRFAQVIHAGKLTGLPGFRTGLGLTTRLSGISHINKSRGNSSGYNGDVSLDLKESLTSNITAQLTFNTDFAETEVDLRQTNLTRFPVYFAEKRTFFIEGSDIFDFGLGTSTDVIPFFSRRIGLYNGTEVPLLAGGKMNGKISNTNFGMLVTRMGKIQTLNSASTLGALRIKQNIFKESSAGVIATYGDPGGNKDVWLAGADFTYNTSEFAGDKNFLAGVWGLINHNNALQGDNSAAGFKLDYPNDLWDINFIYFRIGEAFSPSLGFVPRTGINSYHFGIDYMPRPDWQPIRQFFFMSGITLIADLKNEWESYSAFFAPLHFLLESGDGFEFAIVPEGENLKESFEIEDGINLLPDKYNWVRYGLEIETASKRIINCGIGWWFGDFYNGSLNFIELDINFRPASFLILGLEYEKNEVKLLQGTFDQNLFAGRFQVNLSPDLQISSIIQYDNDSRNLGSNTRLRWTFDLLGDLFIVYNHNINKFNRDMWLYNSNELVVKLTYGFWN